MFQHSHTVNPRISPRGLISQKIFWGGGLFEGGAYLAAAKNINRTNAFILLEAGQYA